MTELLPDTRKLDSVVAVYGPPASSPGAELDYEVRQLQESIDSALQAPSPTPARRHSPSPAQPSDPTLPYPMLQFGPAATKCRQHVTKEMIRPDPSGHRWSWP
jgi:hypothetical protein